MFISSTEEILSEFRKGHFIIMVDHFDRENEGDLMLAAEFATAENINFLLKEARGLVCLTMTPQQIQKLKLPKIESTIHSSGTHHASFTYTIEARQGITTGISARERALTIQTAIKSTATANDIVVPGHVFPLEARSGGVLERAGHTEASVDLAKLSQLAPAGVICEILDENGEAAKAEYLSAFSLKFGIKIGTIENLVNFQKFQQGLK